MYLLDTNHCSRIIEDSENDLWIASVAIRHELIVVSADADFVRMKQVWSFPLESWWQPTDGS